MNKQMIIRELSKQQLEPLLKDNKFNQLAPVSCSECGNKINFFRKLFEVKAKDLDTDEDIRNLACYHVKTKYGIDYVFFKTLRKKYYIDSAICSKCNSTKIIYDININDELLDKISKRINVPSSSIKKNLDSLLNSQKKDLN